MAYTPLTTQVAGGVASAAGWANLVKGNFESMGPHLIARKTSDEPLTSNTTFQDDDVLAFPVGANEIWQFVFKLIYSGGATGDIKFRFTFPTGGRLTASMVGFDAVLATQYRQWDSTTSPSTSEVYGASSGVRIFTLLEGVFITAGTTGTVQLQWAQNTSDATATTVHANSTVWGMKLA